MRDHFTLHIRGVGHWTNKLHKLFEEEYRWVQHMNIFEKTLMIKYFFDKTLNIFEESIKH